jgi:hypothetical protein
VITGLGLVSISSSLIKKSVNDGKMASMLVDRPFVRRRPLLEDIGRDFADQRNDARRRTMKRLYDG